MRKYVNRGGASTIVQYRELKNKVWAEIRTLDLGQHVIHNRDIQEIAMSKAMEMGLTEFQVNTVIVL